MRKRDFVWFLLAALVLVLNAFDAVFTLAWVHAGMATEANPFMAALLSVSPLLFVVVKTILVCGGISFFWLHRNRLLAKGGLVASFGVYAYIVCLIHLPMLCKIVSS